MTPRSLLALAAIALIVGPLSGQEQEAPNDPAVIRMVASKVVEASSQMIARAALDSTPIPLEVLIPPADSAGRWKALGDYLTHILHGRSVNATDPRKYIIEIPYLSHTADSIVVVVTVGMRTRCSNYWAIDDESHQYTWVRYYRDSWRTPVHTHLGFAESFGLCLNDLVRDSTP